MRALVIPILLWIAVLPVIASAIEVSGDVWGTWSPVNNPYEVVGELRVPPESTLVIEPGVFVDFQGHYKFIVDTLAILQAIGTETDSIYFTTEDTATGWHGIRFIHADSNSQISYCRLEYGKATGDGQDRNGGAIHCCSSSPTITNNSIRANVALYSGGAIHCCDSSSPRISDNWISKNHGHYHGGGLFCDRSNPTISNNIFSEGRANWGGGISCYSSSPAIIGNTITDNFGGAGGGISCRWWSTPTISNNLIEGNLALYGAGIYCWSSSPIIRGNTINDNWAFWDDGGGIHCDAYSSPRIVNNMVTNNSAYYWGGGISCDSCSSPTITQNTILGNSAGWRGGGISCWYHSNPTISDNIISDNSAREGGGISCVSASNAIVSSNAIRSNSASSGGGIYSCVSDPVIANNIISGNCATASCGGGIYCIKCAPEVVNNVISGNSALYAGGGIYCYLCSSPTIANNTISGNSAGQSGGGLYCEWQSNPTLTNNILWADLAGNGPEIYLSDAGYGYPCTLTVCYSDVEGGQGNIYLEPNCWVNWRDGNIDVDPLFRDPQLGDFHLMADYCGDLYNSPCIDAGHPDSLDILLDCFHGLGMDRCDMGAYGGRNSGWPTRIDDDDSNPIIPRQFLLHQNYPNPFNATTVIRYQLTTPTYVKLEIFNLFGQRLATLVDCRQQGGNRSVIWDASNFSSGIYFYRLTAGGYTFNRKMVLSK